MEFFNSLKKNPEYDPNLSWDLILKSWEENFLGSNVHNNHFSNPLESDYSFSNSLNPNLNKSFFFNLFDSKLNSDHYDKFTCINRYCMVKMGDKIFELNMCDKNVWKINKSCDYISKPFLRIVLKQNLSEQDIKNLLYLLADCDFSIKMGGVQMFRLPKLLFTFIICEKLSNPISIFDVKEFLNSNSMQDIKNKIIKKTDKSHIINQKYYVKNNTDIYIDIPLLVDFFTYNFSTALIALSNHEITYHLNIPPNKVNKILKYLDNIFPMFEEVAYANSNFKNDLARFPFEFLKMDSQMEYFHCWKGNIMELTDKYYLNSKFIFIIVRHHEITDMDLEIINQKNKDIDVSQFPQIIEIELEEQYDIGQGMTSKKHSSIQLDNIWVAQFEDLIIYGIAADGISNMKNWINVQSECIDSIEKMTFCKSKNEYGSHSNINPNNYNGVYRIVNLTGVKILWSETAIQTNVEIFIINQNLQRIMNGMTGDAYSS